MLYLNDQMLYLKLSSSFLFWNLFIFAVFNIFGTKLCVKNIVIVEQKKQGGSDSLGSRLKTGHKILMHHCLSKKLKNKIWPKGKWYYQLHISQTQSTIFFTFNSKFARIIN